MVICDEERDFYVLGGVVAIGGVFLNRAVVNDVAKLGDLYYHYDPVKASWLANENKIADDDIPIDRFFEYTSAPNDIELFNNHYNYNKMSKPLTMRLLCCITGDRPSAADGVDSGKLEQIARCKESLDRGIAFDIRKVVSHMPGKF